MAAQNSPFVEASYGWPYGSSGWDGDMNTNLVKFSYLHDRNIDAIVSSLPAIVNGKAYFNTADNRLYFDANGQRYSSVTPKWFEVTLRTTGEVYQFDGTSLNPSAQLSVSVWTFVNLVVDRPTADPATWNWAPALQYALNNYGTVRVPRGTYRVATPLSYTSSSIIGDNPANTILEADYDDIRAPLLAMGRGSGLSNILLRYKPSRITGAEVEGDRVLIQCYGGSGGFPLQRTSLRNVRTQHCGTGVYSPGGDALTNKSCFSVEFSTWEMSDFSYRAFDLQSETRTGNVYRNLYISSGGAVVGGIRQPANAGFVLDGEESESVVDQINIEHTTFSEAAVIFRGIGGLQCSTIHLEGVGLSQPDKGYVLFENSAGRIGTLTAYWTMATQDNTAIVKLGSVKYDDWAGLADPNNMAYLNIGTLHLKGIANPVGGDATGYPAGRVGIQNIPGFKLFSRPASYATLDMFVEVESYVYNYNPTVDPVTSYSAYPASTNISFINKGTRRSGVSGAVFSGPHLYVGGATNNSHPMMQDLDAFSYLPTFTWWFDQQTGISHPAAGTVGITISNGDKYRFTASSFAPSFNNAVSCGTTGNRFSAAYAVEFRPGTVGVIWTSGTGTPEGIVTAPVGSMFTRTDGGAGTTLYIKESGAGNTGWIAK